MPFAAITTLTSLRRALSWPRKTGSQKRQDVPATFFCVRGYMKSGTNWVCNLLNLHPEICCLGEFHWQHVLKSLQRNYQCVQTFHNPRFRKEVAMQFERAIKQSLQACAEPTARILGDRTPTTIEPVVFSQAPHICIIRDGRDVLVSRMFHLLTWPNNPVIARLVAQDAHLQKLVARCRREPDYLARHPQELLLSEAAVRATAAAWAHSITKDRKARQNHGDLPILFVRYEDLHRDVEAIRTKMYSFLGASTKRAKPLDGITSPGFEEDCTDSFYRKGQVGDWSNYMTETARRWFNEEAGSELISLGYAQTEDW